MRLVHPWPARAVADLVAAAVAAVWMLDWLLLLPLHLLPVVLLLLLLLQTRWLPARNRQQLVDIDSRLQACSKSQQGQGTPALV
jgi:Flp pilus assembly protein TadB